MPLPADWEDGDDFEADDENAVEAAINAIANGSTVIPRYVTVSNTTPLTLTVARNVYVWTGVAGTWTLPAVSAGTYRLWIYNRGTGNLTVQRAGSDQIYTTALGTSVVMPAGASREFICDGTYWLSLAPGVAAPAHDNSGQTRTGNVAAGTPITWQQPASADTYAVVALHKDAATSDIPTDFTPAVTFAGAALTSLGFQYLNNSSSSGWVWVFGGKTNLTESTSALRTVSVTLAGASGKFFTGSAESYTYRNVTAASALQKAYGNAGGSFTVNVPAAAGNLVWGTIQATAPHDYLGAFSLMTRQKMQVSGQLSPWISGDLPAAGTTSVTVAFSPGSAVWAGVGLALS